MVRKNVQMVRQLVHGQPRLPGSGASRRLRRLAAHNVGRRSEVDERVRRLSLLHASAARVRGAREDIRVAGDRIHGHPGAGTEISAPAILKAPGDTCRAADIFRDDRRWTAVHLDVRRCRKRECERKRDTLGARIARLPGRDLYPGNRF